MKTLEQRMLALGESFCVHIQNGKFYQYSHGGRALAPCTTLDDLVTAAEKSRRKDAADAVEQRRAELDAELERQRQVEEALS